MAESDAEEIEEIGSIAGFETEIQQLFGLFDVPSYARRGLDLENGLARLHGRCDAARSAMLEMVRMRLRQWAAVASGPDDWRDTFGAPVAPLWALVGHEEPPPWSDRPGTPRRRRAAARDLIASVDRFNRRWSEFLGRLDLDPVNTRIDAYNRYYLLEKECALGNHRLAQRFFRRLEPISHAALFARHPTLPTPVPSD